MNIYENVMIGNFLFSLGHSFGRSSGNATFQPLSVNLLQQTPADKLFGDLLIGGIKTVRLIEFKRTQNKDQKEKLKRDMLERTLQSQSYRHLETISREIHWFISLDGAKSAAVPYLDSHLNRPGISMMTFGDNLITKMGTSKSDEKRTNLYREYLKMISLPQGSTDTSAGGVAFFVDAAGTLSYLPIEDLRDLSLSLQVISENIQKKILESMNIRQERTRIAQLQGQQHSGRGLSL